MKHLLTETYKRTKRMTGADARSPEGFKQIIVDPNSFNVYLKGLSEGLDPRDIEDFMDLAENTRINLLENSMFSLNPYETLTMPVLRVFYPKLIAKELVNVKFFPLQPIEKLNELLSLADIHLLPQRADAEDLVMPSKLTNMMASGRPVITTARSGTQVANVVQDCGIVVGPGNLNLLTEAILNLADNQELRKELGNSGRSYALKHWSKDQVLDRVFS